MLYSCIALQAYTKQSKNATLERANLLGCKPNILARKKWFDPKKRYILLLTDVTN